MNTEWLSEDERELGEAQRPFQRQVGLLLTRLAAERERNAELVEALAAVLKYIDNPKDGTDIDRAHDVLAKYQPLDVEPKREGQKSKSKPSQ